MSFFTNLTIPTKRFLQNNFRNCNITTVNSILYTHDSSSELLPASADVKGLWLLWPCILFVVEMLFAIMVENVYNQHYWTDLRTHQNILKIPIAMMKSWNFSVNAHLKEFKKSISVITRGIEIVKWFFKLVFQLLLSSITYLSLMIAWYRAYTSDEIACHRYLEILVITLFFVSGFIQYSFLRIFTAAARR